jgi:hypothetical protein
MVKINKKYNIKPSKKMEKTPFFGEKNIYRLFDEKNIIQCAYDNGVQYVLKLQKIIPKKVVESNGMIDNTLTVDEAIERFYEGQKREKERISLGKEIVRKIEVGE